VYDLIIYIYILYKTEIYKNQSKALDNIYQAVGYIISTFSAVWLNPNTTVTLHGLWASKRQAHFNCFYSGLNFDLKGLKICLIAI